MEKKEKKLGFIFSKYPELVGKPKDFGIEQKIKDSFNKKLSDFDYDNLKRLWHYNTFVINIFGTEEGTYISFFDICNFKLFIDNEAFHYYKKEQRALMDILHRIFFPFKMDFSFNEENDCFYCEIYSLQENILKYGIESSPLKAINERRILIDFSRDEILKKLECSIKDGFDKVLQENLAFERMQTLVISDNIKIGICFAKDVEDVSICIQNDKSIYCALPLIYKFLDKEYFIGVFNEIFSPACAKFVDTGFYDMAIEIFNIKENLK